jgi:YHS domain-containing protein
MIRFLFTRLILPLLIFWVLRYIFKSIGESLKTTAPRPPQKKPPPFQAGGELKKDPVCGTYVSPGAAVTLTVKGDTLHFCSTACRDRYKA